MEDGSVVCVLADTYLMERKAGGLLTKMNYQGADVPPIVRLLADGSLDSDFNSGVGIGDTVRSAALVGQERLLVVKPTAAFLKHLETYEVSQVTCTTDVFFDGVAVRDDQLLLVGRQIPSDATVQKGGRDLATVSASAFPYEMGVWLVDYDFTLVPEWKAEALRADGGYGARWDCGRIAWDPGREKAAVGMFLTANATYGQWAKGYAMQHRGMLLLRCQAPGTNAATWDIRSDATSDPTKQGFEPAVGAGVGLYMGRQGNIYAVSPLTGVVQLVATGLSNAVQTLAVDPTAGALTFYYADGSMPTQKLYKWTGGVETLIGSLSPDTLLTAFDFHSDGTLYGFATAGASQNFVSIDKATGVVTVLDGPFAPLLNEMAFRPSDDTLFIIGPGLALYTYNISTFVATLVGGAGPAYNGLGFAGAELYAVEYQSVYAVDQATGVQTLASSFDPLIGQVAVANGAELSEDADSAYLIAVPFLIREEDSAIYVAALFGKYQNEVLTAHRLYKLRPDGTRQTGFVCPALTNSDAQTGRVFCVALAPNRSMLLVGGRFDRIDGLVGGNIMSLDAMTGAFRSGLLHPLAQVQYSRGGGTRGFKFTAFADGLYKEGSDL